MPSNISAFAATVAALERPERTTSPRTRIEQVAVLGDGATARLLACACLALELDVTLASAMGAHEEARMSGALQIRGHDLAGTFAVGDGPGGVPRVQVSALVRQAVAGRPLILIAGGARALELYGALLAGAVEPEQTVLLVGGGPLASLRFLRALGGGARSPRPTALEAVGLPYWVRENGKDMTVLASQPSVILGGLPAGEDAVASVRTALPATARQVEPLTAAFLDAEAVVLAPFAVAAAGVSPEVTASDLIATDRVGQLIEAIDHDRRQVASAFGVRALPTLDEWACAALGAEPLPDERALEASPVLRGLSAADPALAERAAELVESTLTVWAGLGRIAGVATPTIGACLVMYAALTSRPSPAGGPDGRELGLDGLTVDGVRRALGGSEIESLRRVLG
jgi:hypothetical protein